MASREGAIARVEQAFDDGAFLETLSRRVAIASTSQEPERAPELSRYLEEEIGPALAIDLGCDWEVLPNL
ncbi:MAG: hypothetical protein RIM80_18065 [Alphaproteobacteria bacterium]